MVKWRTIREEVNSGSTSQCCEQIKDDFDDGGTSLVLEGFKNTKWAKTVRDKMKFPMTIKGTTITLNKSDYKTTIKLFAAFTILRYAEERVRVVKDYYKVIKAISGIDPLHALYVALCHCEIDDDHRGICSFEEGIPKLLTVKQAHTRLDMELYELTRVLNSPASMKDYDKYEREFLCERDKMTYKELYKRLMKP